MNHLNGKHISVWMYERCPQTIVRLCEWIFAFAFETNSFGCCVECTWKFEPGQAPKPQMRDAHTNKNIHIFSCVICLSFQKMSSSKGLHRKSVPFSYYSFVRFFFSFSFLPFLVRDSTSIRQCGQHSDIESGKKEKRAWIMGVCVRAKVRQPTIIMH